MVDSSASADLPLRVPPRAKPPLRAALKPEPPSPPAPAEEVSPPVPPAPPRQVRCFGCGFEFTVPGTAETTSCTRCRTALDLLDHTIDAECGESLRTVGAIRVTRGGIVSSARLMATDIELAGKVVDSKLQALRQLRIGAGADFVRGQIQAVDLRVEAGADLRLRNPAFYRNVEVLGRLDATLYATGTVTVRPGGCLAGTVYASRLVVEEGAGLMARPVVGPESWAETEQKMRERFSGSASGPGDAEHVVVGWAPSAPSNR